jgi:hypothetical protein
VVMRKRAIVLIGLSGFLVFGMTFVSPVLLAWTTGVDDMKFEMRGLLDSDGKPIPERPRTITVFPNWAMRQFPRLYDPMLVSYAEWAGWRVSFRGYAYGGEPFIVFQKATPKLDGESQSKTAR